MAVLFVWVAEKRRNFPTSYSGSSWGVELHRNLVFDASSGVIVR